MLIDYFGAADATPLTKTFVRQKDGTIDVAPYPFVKNFNSYREEINDIETLYESLVRHSKAQHCMLKGLLDTDKLVNESRAGRMQKNLATEWLLLDLDFSEGWASVDEFLGTLNPDWTEVSYIFQQSASAGITKPKGLRGHVWLMLDRSVFPETIKQWIRDSNIMIPQLEAQIRLSANGRSLIWPLDITTCQNDKLIYISNPVCHNLDDPIKDRWRLVRKKFDQVQLGPHRQLGAIDADQARLIARLREASGFDNSRAKYKVVEGTKVIINPELCAVTGVRSARGFTYLNLNGGDSWAYYFPNNDPTIVRNFKGEAPFLLEDIAPDIHAQMTDELREKIHGNNLPLIFRDRKRDSYYNGVYDKTTNLIESIAPCSSKDRLKDFATLYMTRLPNPIPDYDLIFNPEDLSGVDVNKGTVNTYKPSTYIIRGSQLEPVKDIPPIIRRILKSICVNEATLNHFLNWFAFIFQTRSKTETAWVFHGVPGTGKGLLLNKIIRPLLSPEYVTQWTTTNLVDKFDSQIDTTCLLWIDEFYIPAGSAIAATAVNKLKVLITEHELSSRAMRQNAVTVRNYTNIIIATNHPDPLPIAENDRRINVAPAQEHKLLISLGEVKKIEKELEQFASYLQHYVVNENLVRGVMMSEAREIMIEAAQSSTDAFFYHIRTGNLPWFASFLAESPDARLVFEHQQAINVLRDWANQAIAVYDEQGSDIKMTRDEIRKMYCLLTASTISPTKFSRMCTIHRVNLKRARGDGDVALLYRCKVYTDLATLHGLIARFTPTKPKLVQNGD